MVESIKFLGKLFIIVHMIIFVGFLCTEIPYILPSVTFVLGYFFGKNNLH